MTAYMWSRHIIYSFWFPE